MIKIYKIKKIKRLDFELPNVNILFEFKNNEIYIKKL